MTPYYLETLPSVTLTLAGSTIHLDAAEIISYTLIALLCVLTLKILSIIFIILKSKYVGRTNASFPRHYLPTTRSRPTKKILIAGDSTALGAGARTAEDTIAGRLARDFPNAEIFIVAQNGARTSKIPAQLKKASGQQYDLILVCTGGNDTYYIGNLAAVSRTLYESLHTAKTMSNGRVILLLYTSTQIELLLPYLLARWWAYNQLMIRAAFQDVAVRTEVPCIELFTDEHSNPFTKEERKKLLALDGIHPNSEGYRLWYYRLWRLLSEQGYRL